MVEYMKLFYTLLIKLLIRIACPFGLLQWSCDTFVECGSSGREFYDNSTILALTLNTSIFDTYATVAPDVKLTLRTSVLDTSAICIWKKVLFIGRLWSLKATMNTKTNSSIHRKGGEKTTTLSNDTVQYQLTTTIPTAASRCTTAILLFVSPCPSHEYDRLSCSASHWHSRPVFSLLHQQCWYFCRQQMRMIIQIFSKC